MSVHVTIMFAIAVAATIFMATIVLKLGIITTINRTFPMKSRDRKCERRA